MTTKKSALLKMWSARLIRGNRAKSLGLVWALDRKSAESEAVEEFKLDDQERKRLVVDET